MDDERDQDAAEEEPEPAGVPEEPDAEEPDAEEPQTLRALLRGDSVSPTLKAQLDRVMGELARSAARSAMPNVVGPIVKTNLSGLAKVAPPRRATAFGAGRMAALSNLVPRSALSNETSMMEDIVAARTAEREAEREWRNGLLAQQRLTVEAIDALNRAQASDRRINVWVLRVAIMALVVAVIGVGVAILLA